MQIALFHEHYKIRYVPKGLSTWIIYVICLLTIIVVPFIVGLAMQNFWLENNYFYHKPEVNFTGRAVLRISTVQGKELLWTSSEDFNSEFIAGTSLEVSPFVSLKQSDNVFEFVLTVPINELQTALYNKNAAFVTVGTGIVLDAIKEASFLPEFIYTIHSSRMKLNMTAGPLLQFQRPANTYNPHIDNTTMSYSSGPIAAFTAADVEFHSTDRLINSPYVHYTNTYTSSPLQLYARQAADLYDLPQFASFYSSRNQSVTLRPYVQSCGGLEVLSGAGSGMTQDLDLVNSFTWRVQLRMTPAVIYYVPSYREVFKWAWIQYFIIAYVIQWVLWKIRGAIVTFGLLDVNAHYHARKAHYKRIYMPNSLWASLFFLICLLGVGGLPFVIGWFMENFWLEDNYFYQKPDVRFTGRGVLRVTTRMGKEYLWTTSSELNAKFIDGTSLEILPFLSIIEEQRDSINNTDFISFSISVPTNPLSSDSIYGNNGVDTLADGSSDTIEKMAFLPEFSYKIRHYLATMDLITASLFVYSRPPELNDFSNISSPQQSYGKEPLCAVTEGDIAFRSLDRVRARKFTNRTASPLGLLTEISPLFNLEYFSRFYTNQEIRATVRVYNEAEGGLELLRQQSNFNRNIFAAQTDLDLTNSFSWVINLRVQNAVIRYKPSNAEAVKWVVIQYFVIGYLLQWAFWTLRGFFVLNGVIATSAREGVNEVTVDI